MRTKLARAGVSIVVSSGLIALSVGAVQAQASFGPIQLQSLDPLEQAETAGETALSQDDDYLTFEGALGGLRGIFRKSLTSGSIQLVAGGSAYVHEAGMATDASAPSISANGRYVSFTSSVALVKAAHSGSNVYVRDMNLPLPPTGSCDAQEEAEQHCPYELASARDGSSEGLSYVAGEGAIATGRVALNASGREVAFVVRGASDLSSAKPGELTTPPLQVAVRYLDRHETVLVSAEREIATGSMTGRPVVGGAVTPSLQMMTQAALALPGAAISGDGTTVAWLGAHIPAQAPTLADERRQIEVDDEHAGTDEAYDEPLWRRVSDGADAPIRRMIGGGDPLEPGCPPEGTLEVPACHGPYLNLLSSHWSGEQNHFGWLGLTSLCDGTPQLSYDGWDAALIGDPDGSSNLYLVNMDEGLDRDQAVRQLTREVPVAGLEVPGVLSQYVPGAGEIEDVAIAPGGEKIAFSTQRQQFPLAPPNYTETPPAQLGVAELYQIDLTGESLVRATHGPDASASEQVGVFGYAPAKGATNPSYSADGRTLAFADTASNLVFGDANDASDAFTVLDEPAVALPGPVDIGPPPVSLEPPRAQWRLSVVPVLRADGSVMLDVDVPGAGKLSASASATVPVLVRGTGRSSRKRHPARRARRRPRSVLALRSIAAAHTSVRSDGLVGLVVKVSAGYSKLLSTKAGIYATLHVSFKGPGGPALTQSLALSLHRIAKRRSRQ
ncbi:MAG TPA: hypothetical protein VFR48_02915 [Solirubrobacteraceae bacterium]|nr:hypothetical protein [Solirubrobacteraceae bacterium]